MKERERKIQWERCDQCLRCVGACIYQSLNACGRYVKPDEVVREVLKDVAFYRNSGGGVTVSGGEPLAQGRFVAQLLEMCKTEGLHVVLDTTGHAPWEMMRRVLQSVDLVLFDIKHLDSPEHKRATGVDNHVIMENLQRSSGSAALWLRIPLIAGFNDSEGHIGRVARLGKALGVGKVSLLPYHEGGKGKCEQMGRPYPFTGGAAPSEGHIMRLKGIIEGEGIRASIGS
jgi:pyruvate formate lyase activating enzyme